MSPPRTPPRLLLIEDDSGIRREVAATMAEAGFELRIATSRASAASALRDPFDLVILDLGLPDGDGLDLCRSLRSSGASVPILILTARDEPPQRVQGLEAGADDYLAKPFYAPELLLRVRNLLRRGPAPATSGTLRSGEIWLDLDEHTAGCGDRPLDLKPRELELLRFLLLHPTRAWTRAQLLDRVWGPGFDGDERTVDSHVRRLRKLVERDSSNPIHLQTVWGVGYRWCEERGAG